MLTAEELLAGNGITIDVEIPGRLLDKPTLAEDVSGDGNRVRLKPLSVQDLRLITRAAREKDDLTAALMVQRSLVEPELSVREVSAMPVGLLQFLLHHVNDISGINATREELVTAIEDPLAQASFQLARTFGWTPDEISGLTLGQVMMHLEMLRSEAANG